MKNKKGTCTQIWKKILDTDQKWIASSFSNDFLKKEATYELNKIVERKKKLNRDDLFYKKGNETYDFQKFKTIRFFGR